MVESFWKHGLLHHYSQPVTDNSIYHNAENIRQDRVALSYSPVSFEYSNVVATFPFHHEQALPFLLVLEHP